MSKIFIPGGKPWPEDAEDLTQEQTIALYESGHCGAFMDPEKREEVDHELGERFGSEYDADSLLHSMGYADSGAGKLCIVFQAIVESYGLESLTKPAQGTGDCVSKLFRDACLTAVCVDAVSGTPDEETGKVEAVPEVSEIARTNGVFANEGIYLNRGHNGQGMSCDQGLQWVTTKGGIVIRKKYANVDLEKYNVSFELRGSQGSPPWLNDEGKLHQLRGVTKISNWEQARDLLYSTKCVIGNCSSMGLSSKRDENGYSRQQGSWGHAWPVYGFDNRPWVQEVYGFPCLALFLHRWGVWNSGPRDIRDSASYVPADRKELWTRLGMINPATGNIMIPNGACWFDARAMNRNWMRGLNSASGWPAKSLPGFNLAFG